MKSLSSQAGTPNTENDMPRISYIENLSGEVKWGLQNNTIDVFDYNVGLDVSADTELIVRCVLCEPVTNPPLPTPLKTICFRIKFNSEDFSNELKDIIEDIPYCTKGIKLEIKYSTTRKIKNYLSDYYGVAIKLFGNMDDLHIQDCWIFKI